jgi:hypothetical protein
MTPSQAEATVAWSRRVRRVGGFIQAAFAAFWLVRGSLAVGGVIGVCFLATFAIAVVIVFAYGIRATAGTAPRPTGRDALRIERAVTIATIVQLAASFAIPVLVAETGHPDWILPSVAITIGPLLLWLDHLVHIPRYRSVGWTLIIGPVLTAATLSGTTITAVTGITAGVLLLATAAAGFHDLTLTRPPNPTPRKPG